MIRPEEGGQLGRYRILRRLGAGAMGEVYLAEDPQIGRRLALKTVRIEEGRPQELEERKKRLLREARAAGKLLHPNIVTLFDAGEDGGVLFLAFEFVDGTDVDKRVTAGPPLTLAEALAIVRQTAEGLDYAHRQGVIHRDIKPSNVMLTADGRVKVADFGIAKVLDSTSDLTMSGSVVGSPHYLSPEQIRGDELDGRTDIFSLGVLLYEILCHRRPFDGETLTTLVYQILNQEPTPVEVRRPDLGPRLERLVRRMLHKDREQRFATAGEVAAEIAACERELAPELLAARAVPDAPTEATIFLSEDGSTDPRLTAARGSSGATAASALESATAARGVDGGATAPRMVPPPPPPAPAAPAATPPPAPSPVAAAPPRAGSGRILVFAAAATLVAGALLALGWGARRWSARSSPPPAQVAVEERAEAPGAATATRDSRPTPVEPEPHDAPAAAPAEPAGELPFQPGERPVVRREAAAEPAPARTVERAAPAVATPPAERSPRPAPPAETRPAPEPAAPSVETPAAPAPEPAARTEPAAPAAPAPAEPEISRDERIARIPVAREMTTGMSLSFELPKAIAERTIVRFDRIVIGRAAEWNASKRGGRAYSVPEPGLHILTFLLDGAEIYRIRIDAQPGRSGPTAIAPEVGEGRPRRRGAG